MTEQNSSSSYRKTQGTRLAILIVLVLLLSLTASLVQSSFGNVDVEIVEFKDDQGNDLIGKLYLPDTATGSSPSAAALLLHGFNNDKDTEAPTAIELSRRGIVVLALDEHNHGDSDNPSDVLGENLDQSLGAIAAFDYLGEQDFVDASNIALVGHSMGGWSANATAEARPSHKAIVFQAFGPLNLSIHSYFNNYLQIWPLYEESFFDSREEWTAEGETTIEYNLQLSGLNAESSVTDTTYGSFSDGTAQRYALVGSTHPGGTWKDESVSEVVGWLLQALEGQSETEAYEDADSHIYYLKEVLMLISLVLSIAAVIPLAYLLLDLEFFRVITQELPTQSYYRGGDWWKLASINALIGGITFVFFPFIGVILFGIIHSIVPIFPLIIGNAYLFWFLLNAVIAHLIHRRWKNKQDDLSQDELGGVAKEAENRREIIGKSFALAFVLFISLYILSAIIQWVFVVELRYMWSFFRVLQPARLLAFFIYLLPVSYFFLMNTGSYLFGQARPDVDFDTPKGLLKWWGLNVYNMLSVLVIVFIIEYFPMFLFGTGPLLGGILDVFWLLGIFLMQIIPEFIVLFLLMTILFRKTGRYYLGSFISTMIIVWVMSTGALA